MLEKLFTNKKLLIVIVVAILVLVGAVIGVITIHHSREDKAPNEDTQIEIDDNKEDEQSDDMDIEYNGNGLEVQDTMDESVNTIDGSGDWDGTSDDDGEKKQDNKTDSKTENTQSEDIDKEEPDKEGINNENEDVDGALDKDILVDDKVWEDPS